MARKPGTKTFNKIARAYGWELEDVTPLSSYYKAVAAYRFHTSRSRYLVKPFRGSTLKLSRITRYMHLLKSRGLRNMPKWMKTVSGKRWVRIGGRLYYATQWIDGHRLGATEDYYQLGRALGKLHKRTRGRTGSRGRLAAKAVKDLRQLHIRFARQLRSVSSLNTPAGRWFRKHGRRCLSQSRKAWKKLEHADMRRELARERRKPSLVHGDVTSFNVLVSSDRLYLIDWEMARPKSAYIELVKALTNTTNFSTTAMSALLKGYTSARPLSRTQRRLIAALYSVPREAFLAASAARSASSPPMYQLFERSWKSRLEAVKWMNRWAD